MEIKTPGRARWCRRSGEARKSRPPELSTKPLLLPPSLRTAVLQRGSPSPENPAYSLCHCCWDEDRPCSLAEERGDAGGARLSSFFTWNQRDAVNTVKVGLAFGVRTLNRRAPRSGREKEKEIKNPESTQ
ncbi:hypothetical protein NDU88_000544 [Pleurodeles waltl]|uniref:Uncharacterized protein n=1 Tax=Pleurodeles waltl TaxID=8319 RepID=A0AAV7SWQ7_PLEWA|nr:hypothetical protein NDU88_000544 [Pleurodeles waltl]